MEKVEFTVRRGGFGELPSAIRGFPRNKRVDCSGDGFAVLVAEQYFFRTNSNLQTTTIFELVDSAACKVTVISGGGGAGLLEHDWGTESGEPNKLLEKSRDVCRKHGLSIEHS